MPFLRPWRASGLGLPGFGALAGQGLRAKAAKSAISTWEQFAQIDLGYGYIALRAHANGKYVTAENAGRSPPIANPTTIGAAQKFYRTPS